MLVCLYYAIRAGMAAPRIKADGSAAVLAAANNALVFAGLAISPSTLHDNRTTQNEFSQKLWHAQRKGMITLWSIALSTAAMLLVGLYGFFARWNIANSPTARKPRMCSPSFGRNHGRTC